ncbi:MAG TPA: hypothetical protein VKV04_18835 [Verrucomicrobiae bacterium]|nr:hypothetical protein [Verrucomicrobiae bacterium]
MKLHSPRFERSLRRAVKKTVRSSPELRREARAGRKSRQIRSGALFRPLLSLGLAVLVGNVTKEKGHPATGLAVLTLWCLAWLTFRVQNLLVILYASNDLQALSMLPVTMPLVFRWEMWKFWRGAPLLLIDLLGGYIALAIFWNQPAAWLMVLPAALLSWAVAYSLVLLCTARFRRLPYAVISLAFLFLGIGLIMLHSVIGNAALQLLDQFAPALNFVLPTGWVASLVLSWSTHSFLGLLFLLPIAAVLNSFRSSLALLRKDYQFREGLQREVSDIVPPSVQTGIARPANPQTPLRVGPTMVEEIITSRQFFAAPQWENRGRLEKWLWNWLQPREKVLAEFAFANGVNLTRPWLKVLRNLAVVATAIFLTGLVAPTMQIWALVVGLMITGVQVLAQATMSGTAFRRMLCSGLVIPFHAVYGIGYRELSRLLLKVTALQAPFILLFTLSASALVACVTRMPLALLLPAGFKCGGLLVAARFITLVFAFSSTTNDSSRFSLWSIALIIVMAGFGIIFLLLGGAGLFVPDRGAAWALWALAMGDAFLFFKVYGFFYRHGRFDLMSLPRR